MNRFVCIRARGAWSFALPVVGALAMLIQASAVTAQTSNPNVVEFLPSPHHFATLSTGQPVVSRYVLTFYAAGTSEDVLSVDLGKPAPQADGLIRLDFAGLIGSFPLPGAQVEARVGVFGPDGTAVSNPSNTFVLTAATSTTTRYLGDIPWKSMINGWGPVERNRSNGEQGASDGRAITLNGRTYARGLGAHARSDVRYALNGTCTSFQADIGVDDESGGNGSIVFEVWADGTRLFSSEAMRATTATRQVSVSVSGKNELALIMTDGGDGVDFDHGDWADARVSCSGPTSTTYLGDIAWTSMTNGWGPAERNRSNGETESSDGRTITLNRKTYAKGLGVHANSDVRYALNGGCSAFQSDIGVDDEAGSAGSVVFQVWADGTKLFESGTMTGTTVTRTVNVNLSGKKQLALIVTDAGNGNILDHADWADARITCAAR